MGIRSIRGLAVVLALAVFGFPAFAVPGGLAAQDAEAAAEAPEVTEENFETLVRVHLEVEGIRDDLHEDMAERHEDHHRQEVREAANERIQAVFEEHGVTAEQYEEFNRMISIDQEHREMFEELLAEIDG